MSAGAPTSWTRCSRAEDGEDCTCRVAPGRGLLGGATSHGSEAMDDDLRPGKQYALWRVYRVGGPVPGLRVRYRDDMELPDWEHGPDPVAAIRDAAREGWTVYDREPGEAPGEHGILHLVRRERRE
jgi:hypothetical protein